jgi:hypothetical protein
MASTYSPLKIELIGTGEQAGTWGITTNTNLGTALEEAITGSADVAFSSSNVTLTLTDTNAAQVGRNLRLNLTGTSGGARELILGSGMQIEKLYLINNGLADAVTVKNTTGTGVVVPAGKSMFVFNNGTNVVDVVTHLTSLTLGSALPIASGGTGSTSTTFVNLATNVTGTLPAANGGTGVDNSTRTLTINTNAGTIAFPGASTTQTFPSTSQTLAGLGVAQTFTAAQTFRAANAIRSEAASTQDAIVIAGRAGGSNSYAVTLTPATLSASRTLTLPEPGSNETLGYINTPIVSQSAAYTLVATDAGKTILHPDSDDNARTFTIPANSSVAYPVGTVVTFVNLKNTVTIAITSDTLYLAGAGTTGSRTLAEFGVATAVKLTSTAWLISGNGLS